MTDEQRAAYMAAYEWMLDVQRRLLFTDMSVSVETHYAPSIDVWSLTIWIHRIDRRLISADYRPWNEEGFNSQKRYIEGFLEGLEKKEE